MMAKKQFKAESKKLMNLMINSIYTNKEIFLREIISNASDAMDKLYYRSLTDTNMKIDHDDFKIEIVIDKEKRTLTIRDNGCGMTEEELENNLGTIAQSGSSLFKEGMEKKENIDIIGQFGVGFYSAFMVSSKVEVISRSYDSDKAYSWVSTGIDGYSIKETTKENYGTDIILTIKEDSEEENYSEYLDPYRIRNLVKKYSDYITYPICMEMEHSKKKEGTKDEYETVKEVETLNSLVPLWKKNKSDVKQEDYDTFYSDKFFDYEKPLMHIHTSAEGTVSYQSLLYIPSHAPYDYYTKEYEKGLQLYSNGVLIMEKCKELLPDYYSFVKGVVDSPDLSLNISRETLQQDRVLKVIAKNIEKKIHDELKKLMDQNRTDYEKFFQAFGMQLKFGVYNNYGMDKDKLQDLLMFYSSKEKKMISLKEYVEKMPKEQEYIYYACGETVDKIDLLPQVDQLKEKDYDILYLTEYVDEFALQTLMEFEGKKFMNASTTNLDLATAEEKEKLKKLNEENKDMFATMKEAIPEMKEIRFTSRLKNHPVCLVSDGAISVEMEKVINAMPTDEKIKASTILEINERHPIAQKLKDLYQKDKDELKEYTKILYAQARLIEGLPIDNPTEISNLICTELSK